MTVTRLFVGVLTFALIGCGNGVPGAGNCGQGLGTSCDVPKDVTGTHTCYDVTARDAAEVHEENMRCTDPQLGGGTVISCCNHDGAVGRCVFAPSTGGMSTEWFFSIGVAAAQSACADKNGVFTAL